MKAKTREIPKKDAGKQGIAPLARAKPEPEGIDSGKNKLTPEERKLIMLRCLAIKGDVHYSGAPEEDREAWTPYPNLPKGHTLPNQEP